MASAASRPDGRGELSRHVTRQPLTGLEVVLDVCPSTELRRDKPVHVFVEVAVDVGSEVGSQLSRRMKSGSAEVHAGWLGGGKSSEKGLFVVEAMQPLHGRTLLAPKWRADTVGQVGRHDVEPTVDLLRVDGEGASHVGGHLPSEDAACAFQLLVQAKRRPELAEGQTMFDDVVESANRVLDPQEQAFVADDGCAASHRRREGCGL